MNKFYQKDIESTTEYILPDYLGDVKKILTVSASAIPSGKFVSDGNVEFSGVVVYDMMYADSDGKLTKLSTTSDYDFSFTGSEADYIDSMAEPKVAGVSIRLTGPRKLIAKATVTNNVLMSVENNLSVLGDAFENGNTPEVETEQIMMENVMFASSSEREYAEEAEKILQVSPDGIEIIATSGAVRITESTASENGVLVKGEIIVTSIIRTDEQPPFAIRKSIPFEETINLEGVTPDMQVAARGYLTSVTTGISEDSEGTSVTVNAIAEYSCYASENKEISVISDAYLVERDSESKYENYSYTKLACMGNCECEFSVSCARADIGCEEIRDVLQIGCDIRSYDEKRTPHGFEIFGDAIISGIACQIKEDDKPQYIPIKFVAPFSVNVNTNCQISENSTIECGVCAVDVKDSLDSENLSVRCIISVSYHAYETPFVKRVCECSSVGENEYSANLSRITVYYPDDGEKLFDIAKKFHTTREKIASDNNLDAAVISSGASVNLGKLIIR